MLNWNVDEERFKKEDPEGYKLWRITQLINYGLDGEKLEAAEIKKAWPKIKGNLDPYKKRLLEYLLWGKLYSLPPNITFWNMHKLMKR
ncbi:hypothetical protein A3D78_00035 [Candidatus Gottesmanbacteria bacterium RIFCSPHIGHO2_02_FULL_39_14]|uniref:Uncharacterized protein n=2 Tax=Candidatus Gottesmaniibacteriota TaxID=1752720 RepID=A0A1F6A308_9BACT|nr:MAG: hypothetical protein A3D78_00035 [Candidatus Gottesmanbacteria bacterium RIFCSPHIGHO2_02_FULL_39_14]OGG31402.1 MAG: hypothetical protein A3I51_05000 [Candidatus Gottesmanbacteria bacterium RIFCSPLOWO2_02_FULL_38_8]